MARKRLEVVIGEKFGKRTVLADAGRGRNCISLVRVQCECGRIDKVELYQLKRGRYAACMSCSSAKHFINNKSARKHYLYNTWKGMIYRCHNPKSGCYKNYGGRGIKVCDRWRDSFQAFADDMGEKPSPKHTLDRIDVDKDYSPENCRWAIPEEQGRNKRTSRSNKEWVTKLVKRSDWKQFEAWLKKQKKSNIKEQIVEGQLNLVSFL